MLTGRSVIIIVSVVAALSLVFSVLSLVGPQDRDGLGADTYGTRPQGFRAIFEILEELQIPVDRTAMPPTQSLAKPVTLVIWGPDAGLISFEPTYISRLGEWVRAGGRVVFAPSSLEEMDKMLRRARVTGDKITTAAEALGIAELATQIVDMTGGKSADEVDVGYGQQMASKAWEAMITRAKSSLTVPAEATGDFAPLAEQVKQLQVPTKLQTLRLGSLEPSGQVTVKSGDEKTQIVAARFLLEKGEIIAVSDPELFNNLLIARADNAILAVNVLATGERTVMWDEFYHGLTIRGQPLYLLTRGAYALFALLAFAATAAWVWRSAIFLGPPLAPPTALRRTLAEYVDAMARFLNRGAASRRFLLAEMRDGVMWKVRRTLGLPLGDDSAEMVAAALARRDVAAARRLQIAVDDADSVLASNARLNDRRTLEVLKGLNDCL